jgi:methyl-accepting chemotaxis protein
MWPFRKRSSLERAVEEIQRDAARLADTAAEEVRARIHAEAGKQLAAGLEQISDRIQHADLSKEVRKREQQLKKTVAKANKRVAKVSKELSGVASQIAERVEQGVEQGNEQLAHLRESLTEQSGEQLAHLREAWPEPKERSWIGPTLIGFVFGVSLGFLIGRKRRRTEKDEA